MSKTIQYKVQVDTGNSVKTLGQLESELAQINEELQDVAIGSDRFKELSSSAQQVTRDLEKANQQVEGFTADKKFQAADGAIKLAAGSLQSFVGGLGLLGIESEALGEFEQKAASAIAVGIGFKDISEGIGQIGPLFKQSGIAAKLFGTTTRTALTATGIGVFVIALGTVVAYWDDIVKGVENFGKKVPFVGKAIDFIKEQFDKLIERFRPILEYFGLIPTAAEKANQAIIESNQGVIDVTEREIAVLQAKGAKQEEIFNAKQKQLQLELENLRRNGAEAEEIYEKETELLVLQAQEEKRLADERDKRRQEQLEKDKKAQEERDRLAEEERVKKEKEAQEALDKENKRLEAIAGILEAYRQKQKDIDAESEVEKINLEEERKLAELERLKATEEEKEQIRAFYRERRKEAEQTDAEIRLAEQKKRDEEEAANVQKQEEVKAAAISGGIQALQALAGESKAVAIGAVIATQAQAIGEIISNTGIANAKAVAAFPVTLGQPWVGINTASAAASIAASILSARRSIQQIQGSGSGSSPAGSPNLPQPRSSGVSAPSTPTVATALETTLGAQDVQEERSRRNPVRAYVVSGDVSSAQEAEAKIRSRRRVGR